MSPVFGRKREEGKTILVLDIESGSVGASLARLSPQQAPKLFGEVRKHIPLLSTHNPDELTRLITRTTEEVLAHAAEVAARVRNHPTLAPAGEVRGASVFFSPPWGTLSISNRALDAHPFTNRINNLLEGYFGPISVKAEPFGLVAAHTTPIILPSDEHYLLAIVSGEVTELLLLEHTGSELNIVGHATLPLGRHYPLRTLHSHGGFSEAEARSALHLSARGATPEHASEALRAAQEHMTGEFSSVAGELLQHMPVRRIVVVAQEPAGEWFARSLAESSQLSELFPESGEVRAARASHAFPFIGQHASKPDLPLLLETLFVNAEAPAEKLGLHV